MTPLSHLGVPVPCLVARPAECYPLQQTDVVAHHSGFADDCPRYKKEGMGNVLPIGCKDFHQLHVLYVCSEMGVSGNDLLRKQ